MDKAKKGDVQEVAQAGSALSAVNPVEEAGFDFRFGSGDRGLRGASGLGSACARG